MAEKTTVTMGQVRGWGKDRGYHGVSLNVTQYDADGDTSASFELEFTAEQFGMLLAGAAAVADVKVHSKTTTVEVSDEG